MRGLSRVPQVSWVSANRVIVAGVETLRAHVTQGPPNVRGCSDNQHPLPAALGGRGGERADLFHGRDISREVGRELAGIIAEIENLFGRKEDRQLQPPTLAQRCPGDRQIRRQARGRTKVQREDDVEISHARRPQPVAASRASAEVRSRAIA